jgi:diadenosine tetraphosphate (Ap4A) HIT family hydrolase
VGQNEQVSGDLGKEPARIETCRWCRLLDSDEQLLCDEPVFVLVGPAGRSRSGHLTLMPKAHVSTVTELSPPDMAAVLAGLTRASDLVRATGAADVQIRPHPSGGRRGRGHLHFRLLPLRQPREQALSAGGEPVTVMPPVAVKQTAFASLSDNISH